MNLVKTDKGDADHEGVKIPRWTSLRRPRGRADVVTPDEIESPPEPFVRPTHTAGTGGTTRDGISVASLLVAPRDGRAATDLLPRG